MPHTLGLRCSNTKSRNRNSHFQNNRADLCIPLSIAPQGVTLILWACASGGEQGAANAAHLSYFPLWVFSFWLGGHCMSRMGFLELIFSWYLLDTHSVVYSLHLGKKADLSGMPRVAESQEDFEALQAALTGDHQNHRKPMHWSIHWQAHTSPEVVQKNDLLQIIFFLQK